MLRRPATSFAVGLCLSACAPEQSGELPIVPDTVDAVAVVFTDAAGTFRFASRLFPRDELDAISLALPSDEALFAQILGYTDLQVAPYLEGLSDTDRRRPLGAATSCRRTLPAPSWSQPIAPVPPARVAPPDVDLPGAREGCVPLADVESLAMIEPGCGAPCTLSVALDSCTARVRQCELSPVTVQLLPDGTTCAEATMEGCTPTELSEGAERAFDCPTQRCEPLVYTPRSSGFVRRVVRVRLGPPIEPQALLHASIGTDRILLDRGDGLALLPEGLVAIAPPNASRNLVCTSTSSRLVFFDSALNMVRTATAPPCLRAITAIDGQIFAVARGANNLTVYRLDPQGRVLDAIDVAPRVEGVTPLYTLTLGIEPIGDHLLVGAQLFSVLAKFGGVWLASLTRAPLTLTSTETVSSAELLDLPTPREGRLGMFDESNLALAVLDLDAAGRLEIKAKPVAQLVRVRAGAFARALDAGSWVLLDHGLVPTTYRFNPDRIDVSPHYAPFTSKQAVPINLFRRNGSEAWMTFAVSTGTAEAPRWDSWLTIFNTTTGRFAPLWLELGEGAATRLRLDPTTGRLYGLLSTRGEVFMVEPEP